MEQMHATTIVAVKKGNSIAIAGDGQVTQGNAVVLKNTARKIRRLYNDKILMGFAGSVADALALSDRFEAKLRESGGNLRRAVIEFGKEWRRDKIMRHLEAMMIVGNTEYLLLLSGTGEIIEPDEGILAIGSGGMYAYAAAKALSENTDMKPVEIAEKAMHIAADICVYTNHNIITDSMEK